MRLKDLEITNQDSDKSFTKGLQNKRKLTVFNEAIIVVVSITRLVN